MATLYKRATPSQARILRAVEGAVKNVADCHPEFGYSPRLGRSIAKRAAGTLSSQWLGVLAATLKPSESAVQDRRSSALPLTSHLCKESGRGAPKARPKGSPLIKAWKRIGIMAGNARRAGQHERHAALVDCLRLIASMQVKK